ncbi:MAG: hypothetical protein RMA76_36060 [Deltaproteobacteria bacterium]|jgi:SAM-dependent methyltransferase
MRAAHRASARRVRQALAGRGPARRDVFVEALRQVPTEVRDAWVDEVFGLDGIAEDQSLPRGCVGYLPCATSTVLRVVAELGVTEGDVFVDIGSGAGRVTALVHLVTGAGCVGLEIQPHLARAAERLSARLRLTRAPTVVGDAVETLPSMEIGTVFFLYCPFGGDRIAETFAALRDIARARPIRICAVNLPVPPQPWLTPIDSSGVDVELYASVE